MLSIPDNTTKIKEYLICLIGNTPFGILALDLDGVCILANHPAAEVFGMEAKTVVDQDYNTLVSSSKELKDRMAQSWAASREDFEIHECEINGHYYHVRARRISGGQLLTFYDITANVLDRQQKHELMSELKRANRDLEDFAYISAHDMKSPINSLKGLFDAMHEMEVVTEEGAEVFDMAIRSLSSLSETVDGINKILKLKKQLIDPAGVTHIKHAFEEVCATISHQLKNRNVAIDLNCLESESIRMSEAHLKSIFMNLLSNAVKYASQERELAIHVSSGCENDRTVIEFADNGIGLDLKRYGDKLFGLFNRFHPEQEGSGVGLYMVRQVVQSHGGSITASEVPGGGLHFRIEVPSAA